MRNEDILIRINVVAADIYTDLRLTEANTEGGEGLASHWDGCCKSTLGVDAYVDWDSITYIREQFQVSNSPYRDYVLAEVKKIEDKISTIKYAWKD